MTPQAALTTILKRLTRLANRGDRADLDAFMESDELSRLRQFILPKSIPVVGAAYDKALERIQLRHRPLAPGKRRACWTADMVARLKASWDRHGNPYRVARELGITEKAAKVAYRKFIENGAAPRQTLQDGRSVAGGPTSGPVLDPLKRAA